MCIVPATISFDNLNQLKCAKPTTYNGTYTPYNENMKRHEPCLENVMPYLQNTGLNFNFMENGPIVFRPFKHVMKFTTYLADSVTTFNFAKFRSSKLSM